MAEAHEVRFVASYGSNTNLCTRDAPCKTLQKGINRAPAGGELIILDSGDYGSGATIDKSITISAIGVSATLGGTIAIDNPNATVILRGLWLNGVNASADANGIDIIAATAIHIDHCDIQNFGRKGVSAVTTAPMHLIFSDSVSRNNGSFGLHFNTVTGGTLVVENSRIEGNASNGLEIRDAEATITRTVISGNYNGILQTAGTVNVSWTTAEHNNSSGYRVTNSGVMTVEKSVARGNAFGGLSVVTGGTGRISNSVVTDNGTGLSVEAGSTLLTRVNNTVSGNATDISGSVTPFGGI
jgi:hypothetical protein